jgi:hypothetical protein
MARTIQLRHQPTGPARRCQCGASIRWATTRKGRKVPIEVNASCELADGYWCVDAGSVHFSNCQTAANFRVAINETKAKLAAEEPVPMAQLIEASKATRRVELLVEDACTRLAEPHANANAIGEWLAKELERLQIGARVAYCEGARYHGD